MAAVITNVIGTDCVDSLSTEDMNTNMVLHYRNFLHLAAYTAGNFRVSGKFDRFNRYIFNDKVEQSSNERYGSCNSAPVIFGRAATLLNISSPELGYFDE